MDGQAYQAPAAGATKWTYKGQLCVATGAIIKIPRLWAIAFGNGAAAGSTNNLYFLAGPRLRRVRRHLVCADSLA